MIGVLGCVQARSIERAGNSRFPFPPKAPTAILLTQNGENTSGIHSDKRKNGTRRRFQAILLVRNVQMFRNLLEVDFAVDNNQKRPKGPDQLVWQVSQTTTGQPDASRHYNNLERPHIFRLVDDQKRCQRFLWRRKERAPQECTVRNARNVTSWRS